MRAEHHVEPHDREELSLTRAAHMLLEECRMILPGIQALFGFQLIAVFSDSFDRKLSVAAQHQHFAAITLVAVAIALIMTPAAFHRQVGGTQITDTFLRLSSRLVLWSMLPLAVGICVDFHLVARVLVGDGLAAAVAALVFAAFLVLWFVLPRARSLQRLVMDGKD